MSFISRILMSHLPEVLWLSASPSLQSFNQPLLRYLSPHVRVAQWEYYQTLDEASSVENAVTLLDDYLQSYDTPIHLAGHGISGVIGLIYARLCPEKVRSLSLLSVAPQPAVTWHTHYYIQRQLMPCSQYQLLAQIARSLFGSVLPTPAKELVVRLDRDLELSPIPHSLFKLRELAKGGISQPLLVCGSNTDPIVDPQTLSGWLPWLKPDDSLRRIPEGHHFFQMAHPQQVGDELLNFWQTVSVRSLDLSLIA
jgi:pimeloyl-ACP methyl ester carboxylesterase